MIISIEIPDAIAKQLGMEGSAGSRRILEALCLDGYRTLSLTHGEVGKILGLNWHEVEAFLKAHDVGGLTPEEHLEDMENLRKILSDQI